MSHFDPNRKNETSELHMVSEHQESYSNEFEQSVGTGSRTAKSVKIKLENKNTSAKDFAVSREPSLQESREVRSNTMHLMTSSSVDSNQFYGSASAT